MTDIKICGLLPGDDTSFSSLPSVRHAGFIFVPGSRRYIQPLEARRLASSLHPQCTPVAVFVNTPVDEMVQQCRLAGITHVQLHGTEEPEVCVRLSDRGFTVWKAVPVPTDGSEEDMQLDTLNAYVSRVDGILFDTALPKGTRAAVPGGHGQTFQWSAIPNLIQHIRRREPKTRIWVAGGLNAHNVAALLTALPVDGVDVSSGVEEDGRKSVYKIQEFTKAVNHCDKPNIS